VDGAQIPLQTNYKDSNNFLGCHVLKVGQAEKIAKALTFLARTPPRPTRQCMQLRDIGERVEDGQDGCRLNQTETRLTGREKPASNALTRIQPNDHFSAETPRPRVTQEAVRYRVNMTDGHSSLSCIDFNEGTPIVLPNVRRILILKVNRCDHQFGAIPAVTFHLLRSVGKETVLSVDDLNSSI
jgi:hypothetical protein